ncbi:MAG TPA: hypothetical protein PLX10_00450 [Candidatus Paceibacterota bacterium]|nr:hypothetical protein [Candidatus Paceibacterota bacterium]
MPTDPFEILKKIFKPKAVVSQENDFYRVYRMAYSDKRLFYKQSLTVLFLIILTAFVGITGYSFLSQEPILGTVFSLWVPLVLLLLLLAFVPLVFFTFRAKHLTFLILFTILLALCLVLQISLKGTVYWQLMFPLLAYVALVLIGVGRMKMTAENQIDFSWWQINKVGARFFIYAYICLTFVFGFWMVRNGSIKHNLDWEKVFTQSVSKQMKHIIPQVNLEGSVDDLLTSIIDKQFSENPVTIVPNNELPPVIATTTTTILSPNKKIKTTTTKVKTPPTTVPNYNALAAQEATRQKTILLASTRSQLAKILGIEVSGQETIFGLMKKFIVTKFNTWGPVITSLLVLVLGLAAWQLINLSVLIVYFFTSLLSCLLLKILLSTKFLQFKTVNIPHKILALNED